MSAELMDSVKSMVGDKLGSMIPGDLLNNLDTGELLEKGKAMFGSVEAKQRQKPLQQTQTKS